jgi:prepilin-type N-terminal cleavage/methylation domain-containing protein
MLARIMLWIFHLVMNAARRTRGPDRAGGRSPGAGFTLVEVMVVVVVLGVLVAIAIPAFAKCRTGAQNAQFIGDVRTAKSDFVQFCLEQGNYPPDVTPAIVPAGMGPYLGHFPWTAPNSLGGLWDWDYRQFGCVAGVSVYQPLVPVEQMQQIDKIIDDGDLNTGDFRQRSGGFISVIE